METYQKLTDIGAIWTSEKSKAKPNDFYRLAIHDSKLSRHEVIILVDAVFQMNLKGIAIPMPDKLADAVGKNLITVDEYLASLKDGGFDVAGLLAFAEELRNRFDDSRVNRKKRAATIFKLVQTQWLVDDDDVKKYIDSDSIYDFMQLVLDHADSTRARLKAIKMHAKDPKQADKALVRECWDDWQKQSDRYEGKAAFARDMRDKFPNLKSQPVIEGWCRKWERET